MTKTTKPLTRDDLDAMTRDERWLGFGYLGGRDIALNHAADDPEAAVDPLRVEAVDIRVLDAANDAGMDYDALFEWANSKDGRHFADVMFGSNDRVDLDWADAVRWNLTPR